MVEKSRAWVFMGPPPYLATCHHCGATLPVPPMYTSLAAFVGYIEGFEKAHRACQPPVAQASEPDGA